MNEHLHHLNRLAQRLDTGYDFIGYSERSPYGYYIHDPQETRSLPALLSQYIRPPLTLCLIDLLALSIESLSGQEVRRQQLLEKDFRSQAQAIERRWTHWTRKAIEEKCALVARDERPVVVLFNTAALHPVSNPSSFLSCMDRDDPCRHPVTGKSIPLILLIPGFPHASIGRMYHFLSKNQEALALYLGEIIA